MVKKTIFMTIILLIFTGFIGGCGTVDNKIVPNGVNVQNPADVTDGLITTDVPDEKDILVPTLTVVPSKTMTSTPIVEPMATAEPTKTPDPTAMPIPIATPTPTATPAPTATPTPVATPTPTATPEPTVTPKPSYTYTELDKTMYAKSSVNVRDLPSTDGAKLGMLSAKDKVTVTGQCNETGWYQIVYDNETAYVCNDYLVDNMPVPSQPWETWETSEDAEYAVIPIVAAEDPGVEETYYIFPVYGMLDRTLAEETFEYANKKRKENGLQELVWDEMLYECARIRSGETSVLFSHTRPMGTDCFSIYDQLHGENLACNYNSAKSVVDAWMNSEGHRANILRGEYTRGAIAVFQTSNGWFYCQLFGF